MKARTDASFGDRSKNCDTLRMKGFFRDFRGMFFTWMIWPVKASKSSEIAFFRMSPKKGGSMHGESA